MTYQLTNPPADERARELWLQHAAGFIVFQDVRQYAIDKIPDNTPYDIKAKIIKGIDDAVYGLMMLMDGVSGRVSNDDYTVTLESVIHLEHHDEILTELNTTDGDGMCMAYHGWKEGDFGEDDIYPIVK